MTIPQEVAEIIVDPKAYADGRIYGSYAWLRANNPLGVAQSPGYDPFWVVTRHADIATSWFAASTRCAAKGA
jgi:hypothetical protein